MGKLRVDIVVGAQFPKLVPGDLFNAGKAFPRLCLRCLKAVGKVKKAVGLLQNPIPYSKLSLLIHGGVGVCENVQSEHVLPDIGTLGGKGGKTIQHQDE